jgi:hypothetical protein
MPPQIWTWLFPAILLAAGSVVVLKRRRVRGRRLYQQHLERALADGILTDDEARELASVRDERDLSAAEVQMVAVSLYRRALQDAIADYRITEEEDETLQRLRGQLALSDRDLAQDVEQLQRIRLFAGVERGELPRVDSPIPLADGELCHWVVQSSVADQLIVPGRGTSLLSIHFDLDTSAPFSASGQRSQLRSSLEILPKDIGFMLVTSRRTMFQGARGSINIPHTKLRSLELFQDGIALDETDPPHASFLLVSDPELTAAVLLCAARKRKNELKNLTTRSA